MTEPAIAHLESVWNDITALCRGLDEDAWNRPTECPGWSVRDNVAHMIGTERMLLGEQAPDAVDRDASFVRNDIGRANQRWIDATRARSGSEVLDEFGEVTARRLAALRALTPADWDREGFTPEGPGPYRQFMEIRVFDCWYHDQDIREALGVAGFLEGPVADLSLARIGAKGLGYIVGKKAGAAPGSIVAFDVLGAPPISLAVEVPPEGRAFVTDAPSRAASAHLTFDRRTYARLAGGRWTGDHARAAGVVRVDGDVDLGRRVVDNMAFTI